MLRISQRKLFDTLNILIHPCRCRRTFGFFSTYKLILNYVRPHPIYRIWTFVTQLHRKTYWSNFQKFSSVGCRLVKSERNFEMFLVVVVLSCLFSFFLWIQPFYTWKTEYIFTKDSIDVIKQISRRHKIYFEFSVEFFNFDVVSIDLKVYVLVN